MSTSSTPGTSRRWLSALKPASWPKILVPTVLGQVVGAVGAARFDPVAFVLVVAYALADVAFIVLLNDHADRDVDALKRRMFPHAGSPKTIPDGILPARAVAVAGWCSGALALLVVAVGERALHRPGLFAMGVVGLAVFVAYSLPPLRLNYRGGGEWLEGLAVGGALVAFQAYAQEGRFSSLCLAVMPGHVALALASAIASGLSDERSDAAGGKRTFVTRWGNEAARRWVERLVVLGALSWALLLPLAAPRGPSGLVYLLPALVLLGVRRRLGRVSDAAVTDAFVAQATYKGVLHRGSWGATLLLSVAILGTAALR